MGEGVCGVFNVKAFQYDRVCVSDFELKEK